MEISKSKVEALVREPENFSSLKRTSTALDFMERVNRVDGSTLCLLLACIWLLCVCCSTYRLVWLLLDGMIASVEGVERWLFSGTIRDPKAQVFEVSYGLRGWFVGFHGYMHWGWTGPVYKKLFQIVVYQFTGKQYHDWYCWVHGCGLCLPDTRSIVTCYVVSVSVLLLLTTRIRGDAGMGLILLHRLWILVPLCMILRHNRHLEPSWIFLARSLVCWRSCSINGLQL